MINANAHSSPLTDCSRIRRPAAALALALALMSGCTFHGGAPATGGDDGGTGSGGAYAHDARQDILGGMGRDVALIGATDGSAVGDGGGCNHTLRATIRDFRGWDDGTVTKHPDFEYNIGSQKGIVSEMLGADTKPVYAAAGATSVTNGPAAFDQWYRDTGGVNERFEISIELTPDPNRPGTYVYDSNVYYPVDNMGFGNQGQQHNYHFTSEAHFTFPYRGGEVFRFVGDDDLWLFVNGHLAIDIGGVHGAETGSVALDSMAATLGISPGNTYQMDIFHAERHTSESTFHIETTLNCIDSIVIP
jgi:fibro-slime domain-containing protein